MSWENWWPHILLCKGEKYDGEKTNNYLVSLEADVSWNTCCSLITLDTHHQRVKIGTSNGRNAQVDATSALYSKSLITSTIQN